MTAIPAESDLPAPTDVLVEAIVSLLIPLFAIGAGAPMSTEVARSLAVETMKSFRIRDVWELLVSGQIVGFGMAAMSSLFLSTEAGLTAMESLRLRANSATLHRISQQQRRELEQYRGAPLSRLVTPAAAPVQEAPAAEPEADPSALQAEADAAIAAVTRRMAASATRRMDAPHWMDAPYRMDAPAEPPVEPDDSPIMQALRDTHRHWLPEQSPLGTADETAADAAGTTAATGAVPAGDRAAFVLDATPPATVLPAGIVAAAEVARRRIWADAMLTVAREVSTEMQANTPAEARLNAIRVSALTGVANALLSGGVPQSIQPFHLSPTGQNRRGPA